MPIENHSLFRALFVTVALFGALALPGCKKNPEGPDNDPVLTDTLQGAYIGWLVMTEWNGPDVDSLTTVDVEFEVEKISKDSIRIEGFALAGNAVYFLDDNDPQDALRHFTGVGSGPSYGFGADFWPDRDSVQLQATQHITAGSGKSWRFTGNKQ